MSKDFIYIEDGPSLVSYCDQVKNAKWLAIDTEFEREKTYYPELALLQVTDGEHAAVIDPLAIEDLSALMDVLYDESITKVFHSARQDLEIFFNMKGAVPAPLFDTQIAAPLLGFADQIGYANLVNGMLGVELSKAHTRTDWKKRPLNEGQLRYAIDDVIYLAQLYEKMTEKLIELGRIDWLDSDFKAMTDPEVYQPDVNLVWKRIRSGNRLKGKKLAVLQGLAKWREETARIDNRPRTWLLKDDAIIDLAHQLPENKGAIFGIKGIHERVARKHGTDILKVISDAQNNEPQAIPERTKKKALRANQEAMVDVMMGIVRLRADENDLSSTVLAPRKEVEKLMINEDSIVNQSWRSRMIGDDLKAFLAGELSFSVKDQKLQVVPITGG